MQELCGIYTLESPWNLIGFFSSCTLCFQRTYVGKKYFSHVLTAPLIMQSSVCSPAWKACWDGSYQIGKILFDRDINGILNNVCVWLTVSKSIISNYLFWFLILLGVVQFYKSQLIIHQNWSCKWAALQVGPGDMNQTNSGKEKRVNSFLDLFKSLNVFIRLLAVPLTSYSVWLGCCCHSAIKQRYIYGISKNLKHFVSDVISKLFGNNFNVFNDVNMTSVDLIFQSEQGRQPISNTNFLSTW